MSEPLTESAHRFYHNRWRAWGTLKRELWLMPRAIRRKIAYTVEKWFVDLFRALQVAGRRNEVRRLCAPDPDGGA